MDFVSYWVESVWSRNVRLASDHYQELTRVVAKSFEFALEVLFLTAHIKQFMITLLHDTHRVFSSPPQMTVR